MSLAFFMLGIQCYITEKISEIVESAIIKKFLYLQLFCLNVFWKFFFSMCLMYKNALKTEIICCKKNEKYFLKMLILRCQRDNKISGYGMFTMCNENFKDVSVKYFVKF